MATFYSVLNAYCEKKNISLPSKSEIELLGTLIVNEFRTLFPGQTLTKVPSGEVIRVNNYPDDFIQNILSLIDKFYSEKETVLKSRPTGGKSFCFDVAIDVSEIFEAVLKRKGYEINRLYYNQKTIQYKIVYKEAKELIFIGMSFEADLKKAGKLFLPAKVKESAPPPKKERKRTPINKPVFSLKK